MRLASELLAGWGVAGAGAEPQGRGGASGGTTACGNRSATDSI
jgi:hypothetical protein